MIRHLAARHFAARHFGAIRGQRGVQRTSWRTFLVTVDGKRYQVPEDQLDLWLENREEEIVEQTPVVPVLKRRGKRRLVKPPEPPEIKVETNDFFIHELIAATNRRILERLAEKRREAEFYRDLTVLLLAG